MTYAAFFLSTGRCGTQWLAQQFGVAYAEQAVVMHEPLQIGYLPRQLFAHRDPARLETADQVLAHVDRIERVLGDKHYIECGWQCYAMIPYFAERFEGRVRIIHVTRHPVPTACSMVTHRYYSDPPRKDRLTDLLLLSPFDAGVRYSRYRDRWAGMNEYEKSLYFWAEVNAYALDLESELQAPWLRLRYEDLFTSPGLDGLLDFLGLARSPEISQALVQTVDRHQYKTVLGWESNAIENHPDIMAVARTLGYDPLDRDDGALRQRYQVEDSNLKLTDLPGPVLVNPKN